MAFYLERGSEMGLPEAKRPRFPSVVEDEDEPCSKETLCGTPFSQASTAPSTPIRFFLPDPLEVDPQPSKYMPRSQQLFAVLEFVDKHENPLADNVNLMEDCCLHIQDSTKGDEYEDVDEDEDEWMKVDDLYIPAEREGMWVLTENPDSVGMPGHALTPEGRLIDLNGGGPVFFPYQSGCSSINSKVEAAKLAKASLLAKLAADVDNQVLCSIDAIGAVRGAVVVQSSSAAASSAQSSRLKLWYWKRSCRQAAPTSRCSVEIPPVMSVDALGKVFLFSVKKSRRREARMVVHRVVNLPRVIMSIDAMGVVRQVSGDSDALQDIEEIFTEGALREKSNPQHEDSIPAIVFILPHVDANGVARDRDHIFVGL